MLLEFSCSNYRSIRDTVTFSMLPVNAYKEHPENLAHVSPVGTGSDGVLSAAVIYGPNASGKTNLLRAMDFARFTVLGFNVPPRREVFFGCENQTTDFSFDLLLEGVRFRYSFSLGPAGVSHECLKARPKQERLVFERTLLPDGSYETRQGSKYRGIAAKLKDFSDNGLVLGLLSKFGVEDCATVFRWFSDSLAIHNKGQDVLDYPLMLKKLKDLGEAGFSSAIQAVKSADLGITGAQLTVDDLTDEERENQRVATDKVKAIFEALIGEAIEPVGSPDKKITFQFQHLIGGRSVGLGFEDESLGTVTMLGLAVDFLDAIANGKTLVVDEIERSLHPVLLRNLVALFFDRELNKSNAQLIFTTHDLSILADDILRRDQFWFVQKDPMEGFSDLYPLSDYSPRKDDNLLNRYLYGAYGAVPFIEEVL